MKDLQDGNSTVSAAVVERRHYLCKVCGATRTKRSLLVAHMQCHPQEEDSAVAGFVVAGKDQRKYPCGVCGVTRSKLSLLRKHMLAHHHKHDEISNNGHASLDVDTKKRKGCDCVECGVHLRKPATLQQHLLSHSNERPFLCPVDGCMKRYKRQDHLTRHLLQHEKRLYPCPSPNCLMVCSNQSNLWRHMRNHDTKGDLQRGRAKDLSTAKNLKCPEPSCEKVFDYPCRVQSHHAISHAFHYGDILCGMPGCGERFQTASALREHVRKLHNDANCEICGTLISRKSYKRHLTAHEANCVKCRLPCPFQGCVSSFANSSNLASHVKVCHMDIRDYKCSHEGCGRAFGYKHSRYKHESTRLHCYVEGDFVEEDLKFRSRSRGGRTPATLKRVDDLFRKRVVGPKGANIG